MTDKTTTPRTAEGSLGAQTTAGAGVSADDTPVAAPTVKPDLTEAERLLAAGFKLCKLHPNSKRPVGDSWQLKPVTAIDPAATGYGVPLAVNGLCSIDPDHLEDARKAMAVRGFDLDKIMAAGSRTVSTRPGSGGRSAFRDPGGLKWISIAFKHVEEVNGVKTVRTHTVIELRASSPNLQDCAPGVVYEDKEGNLCTQRYAEGTVTLDQAPEMPAEFLAWCRRMSEDLAFRNEEKREMAAALGYDPVLDVSIHKGDGTWEWRYASPRQQMFNRDVAGAMPEYSIPAMLERHGYSSEDGGERYAPSTATGAPSVRLIPGRDSLWQSNHASDPLFGTFDAWTAYVVLDHGGDLAAAEAGAVKLQGEVAVSSFEDLNEVDAAAIEEIVEAAVALGGGLDDESEGKLQKHFFELAKDTTDRLIAKIAIDLNQPAETLAKRLLPQAPPVPAVRFPHENGHFISNATGVVFISPGADDKPPRTTRVCSPLRVLARTSDEASEDWGRMLVWHDADGVLHTWAMPAEMLQGDGVDVRKALARQGLEIGTSPRARQCLLAFLNHHPADDRARCVSRLGWHEGAFVLPKEVIGERQALPLVFQNANANDSKIAQKGSVDAWRDAIGKVCAGNSRLVFAASLAFAAPIAALVHADDESGGFHIQGASSTGKSTALRVAASVWGAPSYKREWRATANGLEGVAALHNNGLLVLDELAQCDGKTAGEAAYMLSNGQGKARLTQTAAARPVQRWQLLFLSSGEISLETHMAAAGVTARAGQSIRVVNIPADGGKGLGLFEDIHGAASPDAFARKLSREVCGAYGAVGLAWLRHLVEQRPALVESLPPQIADFVRKVVPAGGEGQVSRVAGRFALAAVAGELASAQGLTGWPPGEATAAARECFAAWLDHFGGVGNSEVREVLSRVKNFFELHGTSRFVRMGITSPENFPQAGAAPADGELVDGLAADGQRDERVYNRAGFYRTAPDGGREYLVLREVFKNEVCKGLDLKVAVRTLIEAGWLLPGSDKTAQRQRLPGMGPTRVYVFGSAMWGDE